MIILIIVSFFLEGVLTVFLDNTLFIPLFSLMSLIVTYPYMNNDKKYYFCVGTVGLLYDIIYTGTPFINTISFLLLALLIKYFFKFFHNHLLSTIFFSCFVIALYRLMVYSFLYLVRYLSFDKNVLLQSIYSSLIINVIYLFISHFILKKIRSRKPKSIYSTNVRKKY